MPYDAPWARTAPDITAPGPTQMPLSTLADLLQRHDKDEVRAQAAEVSRLLAASFRRLQSAEETIAAQAQRIRELESLALTDELTGLTNRRGFVAALHRELARAERSRSERSGCLILIDLDGFKPINDTHGHPAGDACLQAVAMRLAATVRPMDIVARLGGDEFAVLLPGIEADAARGRIRPIAASISKAPVFWQGHEIFIGASHGAALYSAGDSYDDVIQAADEDLYLTKAQNARLRRRASA